MEGKVAIVTGTSSGIGEVISIKFASQGGRITLCGRDAKRLASVLEKVVKIGDGDRNRFLVVQGDVNDQTVRRQIIEQTIEKFGRLDILVLNAGITDSNQSLLQATEEIYNSVMDTNVRSVFFLTQQAVPHLEKCKGNIIFISSMSAHTINFPSVLIYSMSKACLEHLTKYLAVDLGPKRIRVNSVSPGFITTRIMRHMGHKEELFNNAVRNLQFGGQALKTRPLMMKDVAEAVTFLVSDAAAMITGQLLYVDGGARFSGPVHSDILKSLM